MASVLITSGEEAEELAQAQQTLQDGPGGLLDTVFVVPGDEIPVDMDAGFLKGHGTQLVDGKLIATTCGIVARINKLITVRPLKTRYIPETGDVIVGRVTEVAGKRWKVDVGARQEGILMLSAVNLPGGVQRRRTNVDELNMRQLFEETDVISAEVQSFFADGAVALHTRSLKYGKLERGQLVKVPPTLIKRLKHHFHTVEAYGVDLILGCNGYVWVQERVAKAAEEEAEVDPMTDDDAWGKESSKLPVDKPTRENVCRVANAIRVLASLFLTILPSAIVSVADLSVAMGVPLKDMLSVQFQTRVLEREIESRQSSMMADG